MDRVVRLNAIIEVLRGGAGRVQKIFIQKEKGPNKIGEVIHLAKTRGIPFVFMPRAGLDELAPGHQGAVAVLAAREFVPLEDILGRSDRPFLVLLDEVEDPQNLGAIIRTAEAAGADGLVLPERHAAGLTETVMEVSAGAAEHLPVARVKNLAQTMTDLKARGLWLVGAEAGDDGGVVREPAVPVHLGEILDQAGDVVQGVGTLGMTGDLDDLGGGELRADPGPLHLDLGPEARYLLFPQRVFRDLELVDLPPQGQDAFFQLIKVGFGHVGPVA